MLVWLSSSYNSVVIYAENLLQVRTLIKDPDWKEDLCTFSGQASIRGQMKLSVKCNSPETFHGRPK